MSRRQDNKLNCKSTGLPPRLSRDGATYASRTHAGVQAQVESEAVIAIGLLLVFFVAISMITFQRNTEIGFLESQSAGLEQCNRVASVINYFSSSEGQDEMFLDVTADFNVGQETVYVGDFFCFFFGDAQASNMAAGTVRVYEEDNEVRFENV